MHIEKTVLLVDDDSEDLELLQDALRTIDAEHKILEAHDGEQALSILEELMHQERLPCLVILDVNMPKKDGKETLLAIRSHKVWARVPVVILSTSSSLLDKMFFEKYNTAYFIKPVNFNQLVSTAARMINYCVNPALKDR